MKHKFFKIIFTLLIFFPTLVFASSEGGGHGIEDVTLPDPLMVIPFVVLLLMIATGPIFYHKFWHHHYPKVAIALGLFTGSYYLFILKDTYTLMHTIHEYLSFIALLASLFVAAGGIVIKVDRKSTPLVNSIFLMAGAIISNFIGTTGASMLLIRPYIRINQERIKPYHIIFFIFIVSNIGGALTPIGDPPLFLGFLRGVPFFWVIQELWFIWIPCILLVVSIFYYIDKKNYDKTEFSDVQYSGKIEFKGWLSVLFLAIIICSVFIDPAVLDWVPALGSLPFGIREIIMFSIVYFAYNFVDKKYLSENGFDFEPIREVAFLFVGIFLTMIPALQLIAHEANVYSHLLNQGTFYWATGILSAFLDNAPTYLNFVAAAMGKFNLNINSIQEVRQFVIEDEVYLVAISISAVFFGAMTYIGNGPNFMVKSISERSGIKMPSFFEYMIKYSIPILIPVYIIIWLLFFF